jgi:hypothetical protein
MSSEEKLEKIEGQVSIHIPSFEKFLRNWIDNDRLSFILSVDASIGETIRTIAGIATKLPSGLPHIQSLSAFFSANEQSFTRKQTQVLCQYTDLLLDYVIYIFRYYNYEFKMEGSNIDKTITDNILLAKRLTKIYKIISTYIIGNPDLSIKAQRTKIKYIPKHKMIFKLGQEKTMVQSIRETLGLSRGVSQETEYNVTPIHPSLLPTPPSSPRGKGGTRKLRQYSRHRKTSRLSPPRP